MSVKSDNWIARMARKKKLIAPFARNQVRKGVISFGVSSYGYDFRLWNEFQIFNSTNMNELDPKKLSENSFTTIKASSVLIPPNSFILARSLEYFRIPRDIITVCYGKSTYARCGIVVNVTPFEPEWEGYATISISNTSPLPARIYANEGIAQLIFIGTDELCNVSYADKKGKYQAQKKITRACL